MSKNVFLGIISVCLVGGGIIYYMSEDEKNPTVSNKNKNKNKNKDDDDDEDDDEKALKRDEKTAAFFRQGEKKSSPTRIDSNDSDDSDVSTTSLTKKKGGNKRRPKKSKRNKRSKRRSLKSKSK